MSNDSRSASQKGSPLLAGLHLDADQVRTAIRMPRQVMAAAPEGITARSVRADASLVVGIAHRVETTPAGPEILDHFGTAPTAWRTVIKSVMPHGMTVAAVPEYETKHRLSPRRSKVRTVPTPCFFRNGERLNAAVRYIVEESGTFRMARIQAKPPDPCPQSTRDHDRGWSPTTASSKTGRNCGN